MTALQRMGDPEEVGAAAFLVSSDSSFMNGSEVAVDGGLAQLCRATPGWVAPLDHSERRRDPQIAERLCRRSYRTGASRFISFPLQKDHLPTTSPNLSANFDAGMAPARCFPNLYSKRNKETR